MPLFKPSTALKAQLNSGYKDSDYAISEIIDNSIEAEAKNIDIYIVEKIESKSRSVWKINEIAILDDGIGMPKDILGQVLTFGFGTHISNTDTISTNDFGKMGKFGYGLPNASVSQALDIHVWSWQNGYESAHHSSLNVPAILSEEETEQSEVTLKDLPSTVLRMSAVCNFQIKESGTLVLWKDTAKCTWSRGKTLIEHLEKTVGRIFRKFIANNKVRIRVAVFKNGIPEDTKVEAHILRPNDPLFLTSPSIAEDYITKTKPLPIGETIFIPDGEDEVLVHYNNTTSKVTIRSSIVSQYIRQNYLGNTELGKIARDNCGVSICRSGRELELSKTWIHTSEPQHRWWGIEIDFPPALDNIFGVTSNKQSAIALENFARLNIEEFEKDFSVNYYQENPEFTIDSDESGTAKTLPHLKIIKIMQDNDDPSWVLLEVARIVRQKIDDLFKRVKSLKEGSKKPTNRDDGASEPPSIDVGAEKIVKEVDPIPPRELSEEKIKELLEKHIVKGEPIDTIESLRNWYKSEKKFRFEMEYLESNAFFTISPDCGRIVITLNTNHPAWEAIFEPLKNFVEKKYDSLPPVECLAKDYDNLRLSLVLMLYAWAKMELDNGIQKEFKLYARTIRDNWGLKMDELLSALNEQNREEG